ELPRSEALPAPQTLARLGRLWIRAHACVGPPCRTTVLSAATRLALHPNPEPPVWRLAAGEAGLALFLEGRQAFLHVVAVGMHLAREEFEPQGGFDRLLGAVIDERLHAAQDQRALAPETSDEPAGGIEQFGIVDHLVDQARRYEFLGGHEVTGEQEVLRASRTNLAGQAHGASAAGQQAEVGMGIAQPGRTSRDDQVAAQDEFETARQRQTIDRGNRGL